MRGLVHFIIHVPQKYNDTFRTESGMELYGDRRWSAKEMANTIVEVVNTPFMYNGPIKPGQKIFVDPTVLFQQIYAKTGEQENIHLVNRENNHYKLDERLIIAYLEGETWRGHNDNLLIKLGTEQTINTNGIHLPEMVKNTIDRKKGVVVVDNASMQELGVNVNDTVLIEPLMGIDVWFLGQKLTWVRNKDLMALVTNQAV